MAKAMIYAVNNTNQTIASTGSVLNFGSVVRKFGCGLTLSGGNIVSNRKGYLDVDTNLTLTATGTGTALIQIYQDGNLIPGANASFTTAADGVYAVSFSSPIRQKNCESTISVSISGVNGTVTNASIEVNDD